MRISGKEADAREAAIRDPNRVGYFGSWALSEETITVTSLGNWWHGDELTGEQRATMGGDELDRRASGY